MSVKSFVAGSLLAINTLFAISLLARDAVAAEIKLLASPGVRAVVSELLPAFEARGEYKVTAEFAVIAVLKRRIDAGEAFDIVIPDPALIDELITQRKIAADTRVAFGRTGLGVAVVKGAPKPDISSVENFRRALLNAKVVAYSKEGASGRNFLEALRHLGISEEMQPKLKPTSGGDAIQKGEADMAISGMGPAMEMAGADYLGGLPAEIQRYVAFAAGVSATTKYPQAAKALLNFLVSPAAAPAFKAKGLEQGVN
jgi:molybdate transport system substrate-binding protein